MPYMLYTYAHTHFYIQFILLFNLCMYVFPSHLSCFYICTHMHMCTLHLSCFIHMHTFTQSSILSVIYLFIYLFFLFFLFYAYAHTCTLTHLYHPVFEIFIHILSYRICYLLGTKDVLIESTMP